MKTMDDFKGTKDEFQINSIQLSDDYITVFANPNSGAYTIGRFYGAEKGSNAKLFAVSKKLLEAAIEVCNGFETDKGSLHHKIWALEQAINEVL